MYATAKALQQPWTQATYEIIVTTLRPLHCTGYKLSPWPFSRIVVMSAPKSLAVYQDGTGNSYCNLHFRYET